MTKPVGQRKVSEEKSFLELKFLDLLKFAAAASKLKLKLQVD